MFADELLINADSTIALIEEDSLKSLLDSGMSKEGV